MDWVLHFLLYTGEGSLVMVIVASTVVAVAVWSAVTPAVAVVALVVWSVVRAVRLELRREARPQRHHESAELPR